VGLIADTQGRFDIDALLRHVGQEFREVDEIWHAGDWGYPEVLTGLARLARLVVVNGNAPDDPRYPRTMEGRIGRWRVGMVDALERERGGWAGRFDVVIHGHAHSWRGVVVERIRVVDLGTAVSARVGGTDARRARGV